MWRIGPEIEGVASPAVATWYSSGWKRWWLVRSTSVISTGAPSSARTASMPPKPQPTTTTRGRGEAEDMAESSCGDPCILPLLGTRHARLHGPQLASWHCRRKGMRMARLAIVLIDRWADWEPALLASGARDDFGDEVRFLSPGGQPVR